MTSLDRGVHTLRYVARTYRTLHQLQHKRISPFAAGNLLARDASAMGPLYTKLAQFISARTDALDPDFIKALSAVQDSVPAGSQGPPDVRGLVVEPVPVACASIANVYRATSRKTGRVMAIKRRREGCKEAVQVDLPLLSGVMAAAACVRLPGAANMRELIDESSEMVLRELDFRHEAAASQEFRALMAEVPWVMVPSVLHASEDTLISQFVASRKLSEVSVPNPALAQRLMTLYMEMMRAGYVHADPHPGNLGFKEDGTIVLYDFGAMVRVDAGLSQLVARAITAGLTKNADDLLTALEALDVVRVEPVQRAGVRRVLRKVLDGEVHEELRMSPEFTSSGGKRILRFSQDFIYLTRTLTLIYASCRQLDPSFEYDFARWIDRPDAMSQLTGIARDVAAIPSTVQTMHNDLEVFQTRIIEEIDHMKRAATGVSVLVMLAVMWASWGA